MARHAVDVAVLLVDDPRYTDQSKRELNLAVRDYGSRWEPDADFVRALGRSALVDRALAAARERMDASARKATRATPANRPHNIAKYEPAHRLGKNAATLMVTEGDSAKNFGVAGISVVGRRDYGIYPIRGKPTRAACRPRPS